MKNTLLLILVILSNYACSQNVNPDYKKELSELKKFVDKTFDKNPSEIKTYVVNSENGKLFQAKTDDLFSEFDFEFENVYSFLRKNDKLVYIQKNPISPSGDSAENYEYFFSDSGRLIGAKKSVSSFYGNNQIARYFVEYELSEKTDKLERVKEYMTDENEKVIDPKSKLYKEIVNDGMLMNYIQGLEKIAFRDLEGFMKVEKLKYYK